MSRWRIFATKAGDVDPNDYVCTVVSIGSTPQNTFYDHFELGGRAVLLDDVSEELATKVCAALGAQGLAHSREACLGSLPGGRAARVSIYATKKRSVLASTYDDILHSIQLRAHGRFYADYNAGKRALLIEGLPREQATTLAVTLTEMGLDSEMEDCDAPAATATTTMTFGDDTPYASDQQCSIAPGGARDFLVAVPRRTGNEDWTLPYIIEWKRALRTRDQGDPGAFYGWQQRGFPGGDPHFMAVMLATAKIAGEAVIARDQTQREAVILAGRLEAAIVYGPGYHSLDGRLRAAMAVGDHAFQDLSRDHPDIVGGVPATHGAGPPAAGPSAARPPTLSGLSGLLGRSGLSGLSGSELSALTEDWPPRFGADLARRVHPIPDIARQQITENCRLFSLVLPAFVRLGPAGLSTHWQIVSSTVFPRLAASGWDIGHVIAAMRNGERDLQQLVKWQDAASVAVLEHVLVVVKELELAGLHFNPLGNIARLVDLESTTFATVADAIVEGPSSSEWNYIDGTYLVQKEQQGWELLIPVGLLKQGERDIRTLTDSIDPATGVLVEYLLGLVLHRQAANIAKRLAPDDSCRSKLLKILGNVLESPQDTKFRRLRRTNSSIAAILDVLGAQELLVAVGFKYNGEFLQLPDGQDTALLAAVRRQLTGVVPDAVQGGAWGSYNPWRPRHDPAPATVAGLPEPVPPVAAPLPPYTRAPHQPTAAAQAAQAAQTVQAFRPAPPRVALAAPEPVGDGMWPPRFGADLSRRSRTVPDITRRQITEGAALFCLALPAAVRTGPSGLADHWNLLRDEVLPRLESSGWHMREALLSMRQGERDLNKLARWADSRVAAAIEHVLVTVQELHVAGRCFNVLGRAARLLESERDLFDNLAEAIVEGPESTDWSYIENTYLPQKEAQNWQLRAPVNQMKRGERDIVCLTNSVDPNTGIVVEHILLEVLAKERRPALPTPAPVVAEAVFFGPDSEPCAFRLGQRLGKGGYGTVHECVRHADPAETMAVKMVDLGRLQFIERPEEEKRKLLKEISILERFHHENIVKLRAVVSTESTLYIVMELVRGGDLFNGVLVRWLRLGEDQSWFIFKQLVKALQYIHSKKVIHRDLKPDNILVDDEVVSRDQFLKVKISDFGCSKEVTAGSIAKTCVGTPQYMAPEVASKTYDKEVDLWSLGAVLYVMLEGRFPFKDEECFRQARFEFTATEPETPPEPQHLIRALLQVDPSHRLSLDGCMRHPWVDPGQPSLSVEQPSVSADRGSRRFDRGPATSAAAMKIPELGRILREARLEQYIAVANDWCDEAGAQEIEEVREDFDTFAEHLNLRLLEVKRLQKALGVDPATLPTVVVRADAQLVCPVPGLPDLLKDAGLDCLRAALDWCNRKGAVYLEEILESLDDFASALRLKELEIARLRKWLHRRVGSEGPANDIRFDSASMGVLSALSP